VWMAGLVLYCLTRVIMLRRVAMIDQTPEQISRTLRVNVVLSLLMITALGLMTTLTFVAGFFASPLMIPISLAFGATSIAHCLYTVRPAAIGAIIGGMVPSSIAMLIVGDFEAQMMGLSILTVAVLMIRFVAAQYDQLVSSLQLEGQIMALANTDPLTGLANRRAIMAALDKAHSTGGFAVALLDLDGFKQINDSMGHQAGDLLLKAVAERLLKATRRGDIVGRLGGDEFVVLMHDCTDEADISAQATAILAGLCQPLIIGNNRVAVAASLGFARYPHDGVTIDEILHVADQRLYAVKKAEKAKRHKHLVAAKAA
jgi:diguanylate cyclase